MSIIYKLFKPEVVRKGDTYIVGIGGFSTQITIVEDVDTERFTYRNELFVSRHEFRDNLDGILEKIDGEKVIHYLSESSLEQLRKVNPEAVIDD